MGYSGPDAQVTIQVRRFERAHAPFPLGLRAWPWIADTGSPLFGAREQRKKSKVFSSSHLAWPDANRRRNSRNVRSWGKLTVEREKHDGPRTPLPATEQLVFT